MPTIRLTLEYDGTAFAGWAAQPGRRTVEGEVRDALDRVFPHWTELAVAGRTDAGVHASGQVASLVADGGPPPERAFAALNAILPVDVAVLRSELAPEAFHARFSATGRSYRYRVVARRSRSPLLATRALWHPRPVDDGRLAEAAAAIVGEHDFRAFTPTETQHEVFERVVASARWERDGEVLSFVVTADSFLRHMVRTLVGTMLAGADGDTMARLVTGRPRTEAGPTAPACGLCLEHVEYPPVAIGRPEAIL